MALGALRSRTDRRWDARALHDRAVRQARAPALYAAMGAPDTVEGRFELLALHVFLLVDRLEGEAARDAGQAVFDVFIGDLDGALREMGVGDLAVPRRMKRLAAMFYGRAAAWRGAFAALPDEGALAAVVGRTILAGVDAEPAPLAAYIAHCRRSLAATPLADLLAGAAPWPDPRAAP